ncbi:hypothetical protein GALMADRAFT_1346325 [Galerina marginata CBS 339.88]|uniref:Uncharacterized protein n=1 Tax=Galerina marginata (strain CBS 339.88) TaxID=685588 RepID=A0A067SVH1_GALM3|nr:hypothetical protein GALMADRAFT_1346325 [Galerina marginata CBS 339.88]
MSVPFGPFFDVLDVFMKLAYPTADLRQEIMNFNITKYFQSSFGHEVFWYMPNFLHCITDSQFIDAHDLVGYHTQLFEQYAISQLDSYYAEPRLLSLVSIIGSGTGWLPHGITTAWMRGDGIGNLFRINRRLRNIDQNGLGCLPREENTFGVVQDSYFNILASFLNDGSRANAYVLDGDKYAMAAIYVLRYTSDHSQRKHQLVANYSNRNTPTFKNSPSKLRRRASWMKVAFGRREKLQKKNQFHSLEGCLRFYFKLPEASKFNEDWLWRLQHNPNGRAFQFGLECLPKLLIKAGQSEELIDFIGRQSFGPISTGYPREIKVANKAIRRYVKRMEFSEV